MAAKTSLTVADLERTPDIHSRNVELDEGEPIEMAPEDHGNLEATGADRILDGDDAIDSPELLPGFATPISAFFSGN